MGEGRERIEVHLSVRREKENEIRRRLWLGE